MRIGIDLGGTKTEVIALSDQGEQLISPPFADSTRGLPANDREYRDAGRDGGAGHRAARQRWRRDPGVDFTLYRGSEKCQFYLAQRSAV